MPNLKPLRDLVAVSPDAMPERTASGLFLPDHAEVPSMSGTVLALGPACNTVQIGDRVLFPMEAGYELTINEDEPHILLRETELLGIVGNHNA